MQPAHLAARGIAVVLLLATLHPGAFASGKGSWQPHAVFEMTLADSRAGTLWRQDFDRGWDRSSGLEMGIELGARYERHWLSVSLMWRGRAGEHLPARGRLLEAMLAARWSIFELRAGRGYPYWAPAEDAALLLSHNPPPLDHAGLQVGPVRAPLVGGRLEGESFLAYLDDRRREIAYPWLWGMRLQWAPTEWLRLEIQRTVMLAGSGRGEKLTWSDIWDIFIGRGEGAWGPVYRPADSDQKLAGLIWIHPQSWAQAALGLHDLEAYYLYAGEDTFDGLAPMAPGIATGLRVGPSPRWAFAGAYTTTTDDGNLWYWHKIYRTGYTYRGYVLGHPMGGDARSWLGGVYAMLGERQSMRVRIIHERRGYNWDGRAAYPASAGGFWRWEFGISAHLGRIVAHADVGASTAQGWDRTAVRPASGFARLRIELARQGRPLTLDREQVWGRSP